MNDLSPILGWLKKTPDFNKIPFSFLPAKAIRGLHRYGFPYFGELLYINGNQRLNLREGNPSFLIRVDDFPRCDLDTAIFEQFHQIFSRHHINYVLGVTPFLNFTGNELRSISDREVSVLQKISNEGVALALHGFTHEYKLAPYGRHCETYFYSTEVLCSLIKDANNWFHENGLPKPRHYIPPFNTFSRRDFDILSKEYMIFHGGPLSLTTFGKFGVSWIEDSNILYLPSFEPFYNRAEKILQTFHSNKTHFKHRSLYSLTLHWAWEHESGFKYVDELLMFLKKKDWLLKNE